MNREIYHWRRGNVIKTGDFAKPELSRIHQVIQYAEGLLPDDWQLWQVGSCVTNIDQAKDVDWVTVGDVTDYQQLENLQLSLYQYAYCVQNQQLDLKHYHIAPDGLIYCDNNNQISNPDCVYYFVPDVEFSGPGYHTKTQLTAHEWKKCTQYLYESNLIYSKVSDKLRAEVTTNKHRIRCRRLI